MRREKPDPDRTDQERTQGDPWPVDAETFQVFLERHRAEFLAHARRLLARLPVHLRLEPEDLLQRAAVTALEKIGRAELLVRSENHFRNLFGNMLETELSNHRRGEVAQKRGGGREPQELPPPSMVAKLTAGVATRIDGAEQAEALRQAMLELEQGEREVLWLRAFEDLPFAEVGSRLGIAEDAARMRYNRALKALGKRLGK